MKPKSSYGTSLLVASCSRYGGSMGVVVGAAMTGVTVEGTII